LKRFGSFELQQTDIFLDHQCFLELSHGCKTNIASRILYIAFLLRVNFNEREIIVKFRTLTLVVVILACAAFTQAGIISVCELAADGDGVITCSTYDLLDVTPPEAQIKEYEMGIYGDQHSFETGHILGPIVTLTEDDPKLTLLHDIDNETLETLTDYHAQITMNKTFTIDNVSVANTGWTWVITQPTLVGSDWVGSVDYYSGTPVAPSATLSFGYRMTFVGSTSISEALTPSVPEPGMITLLACGLVGRLIARRRIAK
jgi:hypothetical protein